MRDVLDPEAVAIEKVLWSMGYRGVRKVLCGKRYVVELNAKNEALAREKVEEMARRLFANLTYQSLIVHVTKKAP